MIPGLAPIGGTGVGIWEPLGVGVIGITSIAPLTYSTLFWWDPNTGQGGYATYDGTQYVFVWSQGGVLQDGSAPPTSTFVYYIPTPAAGVQWGKDASGRGIIELADAAGGGAHVWLSSLLAEPNDTNADPGSTYQTAPVTQPASMACILATGASTGCGIIGMWDLGLGAYYYEYGTGGFLRDQATLPT